MKPLWGDDIFSGLGGGTGLWHRRVLWGFVLTGVLKLVWPEWGEKRAHVFPQYAKHEAHRVLRMGLSQREPWQGLK